MQHFASSLIRRRGKVIFNCAGAILAGGFSFLILGLIPYYPADWRWPIVLAIFILWTIKPDVGVIFALATMLLPVAYNSLTLALLFLLLLLFISLLEIGALRSFGFLILAGITLVILQPQISILLAIAPLSAGFLGIKRGIVLGAFSGLWAQILALLGGQSNVGLLIIPAQTGPLVSILPNPVSSILDFGWLSGKIGAGWLNGNLVSDIIQPFVEQPVLIVQIGLWAAAAGLLGWFISRTPVQKIPARFMAIGAASAILSTGYLALSMLFGLGTLDPGAVLLSVMGPAILVAIAAPVLEKAATLAVSASPLNRRRSSIQKVFISYSSKDKSLVDNILTDLEANDLTCWMAPRDIGSGEDWPTAIANAIAASQVMVLVFSENSNTSEEVSRELSLAVYSQVIILPFKIGDVEPDPGKAVYLKQANWLNAMNPPTPEQVSKLIERIHSLAMDAEPTTKAIISVQNQP